MTIHLYDCRMKLSVLRVTALVMTIPFVLLRPCPLLAEGLDEALRAKLLEMRHDDQESARLSSANASKGLDDPALAKRSIEVHRRNAALIRAIVDENGWPGRSLVGDDGSSAAWIVVQHMDDDRAFQRRCVSLMEAAFLAGEVSAHDLAYLTDRVLSAEHKPQKYGTQVIGVTSPEDEARVDKNRALIGLEPWKVFIEKRRKYYEDLAADSTDPPKAPDETPDATSPSTSPPPKPKP